MKDQNEDRELRYRRLVLTAAQTGRLPADDDLAKSLLLSNRTMADWHRNYGAARDRYRAFVEVPAHRAEVDARCEAYRKQTEPERQSLETQIAKREQKIADARKAIEVLEGEIGDLRKQVQDLEPNRRELAGELADCLHHYDRPEVWRRTLPGDHVFRVEEVARRQGLHEVDLEVVRRQLAKYPASQELQDRAAELEAEIASCKQEIAELDAARNRWDYVDWRTTQQIQHDDEERAANRPRLSHAKLEWSEARVLI